MFYEDNAWLDNPDPRDMIYSEMWGSEDTYMPDFVDISLWVTAWNQWLLNNPSTRMACGSYSVINWVNSQNLFDDTGLVIDHASHWAQFVDAYRPKYLEMWFDPIKSGSYKQDQLKFAKRVWYISWYVLVSSIIEMMRTLAKWRTINTGSKQIDRKKTRENISSIAQVTWSWSAHLFQIIGYDRNEQMFKCINSYGPDAYSWWFFYLPFSEISALYSMHWLIDKKEEGIVKTRRQKVNRKISRALKKIKEKKKITLKEQIILRNRWYRDELDEYLERRQEG